jgi:hypothetical protein
MSMTFYSTVFLGLMASIIGFFGYFPGLSFLIAVALLIGLLLTFLLGVYAGQSISVAGKSRQDLPLRDAGASTKEDLDFRVIPHLVGPARRSRTVMSHAGLTGVPLDSIGE